MNMPLLSQPSFGPRTALTYVTTGALLTVWTGVWYFTFRESTPLPSTTAFWLWGLFLTGLTLVVIGVLLGPLGRSARKVELPPVEQTEAEARIQQTAAATPHPVVPVASKKGTPGFTVVDPNTGKPPVNSPPMTVTATRTS
jgi:hypothetical protein